VFLQSKPQNENDEYFSKLYCYSFIVDKHCDMKLKNIQNLMLEGENGEFAAVARLAFEVASAVRENGGRAIIVGGTVRDLLLKMKNPSVRLKDIDIEVFGIETDALRRILKKFGRLLEVGVSFAVFKLEGLDISLPRRDNKVAVGHKGFIINADPSMSFKEASRRRSFTINSMGLDPLTGEILDEWNGKADLENRVLRAVDSLTFGEDSLRVLRGMQFAGRFDLIIDPETLQLCRATSLDDLSEERIGEEWMKLLLRSERPSVGLQAAMDMLILERLHPELHSMAGVKQQHDWHPEGDVWEHTKLCVDAMADIIRRENVSEEQAEVLMLAALLHDIGKPPTTEIADGYIHSYNHHTVGEKLALGFMVKLKRGKKVIKTVLPLIREHLFLTFAPEPGDKALRRLAVRLKPATIRLLAYVIESDLRGMHAGIERIERCQSLLDRAAELELAESMPEPLLTGKMLIARGYEPGPSFGDILDTAYDAQLNGEFDSVQSAKDWLDKYERKNSDNNDER
jgi:tRNA nucleotidyltransferase (CCA-adding enzyme)